MTTATDYDLTGAIIAYETGTIETEEELLQLFQHLVDTGLAWSLQGHYGRTAVALIEAGHIADTKKAGAQTNGKQSRHLSKI